MVGGLQTDENPSTRNSMNEKRDSFADHFTDLHFDSGRKFSQSTHLCRRQSRLYYGHVYGNIATYECICDAVGVSLLPAR